LSQLSIHNSAERQTARRSFAVSNDYRNHVEKIFQQLSL
jgi:hypothetical protein